jgi:hypothetical protein
MKAFLLWLAIAVSVFAGSGAGYHLYLTQHPRKVLIAIDSSFDMNPVWRQVQAVLEKTQQQRYTRFCVVTEKNKVHGWMMPPTDIGKITPYAPRDFSKLVGKEKYPEIGQAQKRYLITNAAQTQEFDGWEIVRLKQ